MCEIMWAAAALRSRFTQRCARSRPWARPASAHRGWTPCGTCGLPRALKGVIAAVQRHDTPVIFDWLIDALSYQGVSDSIAWGYMERHGRVRWYDIATALAREPSCPKLTCYWTFEGCGYQKGSGLCANPEHQPACPLPRHDLRNGRLNQTAYSLFLFMRDLMGCDIVAWIDGRLAMIDPVAVSDRPARLRQALLEPLGHVYGVSNKVLAMALSELLLAGDAKRPTWIEAGTVMIAIDTLAHNFLHRPAFSANWAPITPTAPAAIDRAVVPRSSSGSPAKSMRAASTPPSRRISLGSYSTRFGVFARS
jgi:hypothetical protein